MSGEALKRESVWFRGEDSFAPCIVTMRNTKGQAKKKISSKMNSESICFLIINIFCLVNFKLHIEHISWESLSNISKGKVMHEQVR